MAEAARDPTVGRSPDTGGVPPSHLSQAHCARISFVVRDAFEAVAVPVLGTSIERELTEVDWLSSFGVGVFEPGGAYESDRVRAQVAIVRALRLKRLAWALGVCSKTRGFRALLRRLRSLSVEIRDPQGTEARDGGRNSWDMLFELELAALVTTGSAATVTFEEPDLVVRIGEYAAFGIACKRPQHGRSLEQAVRKASRQFARSERVGLLAVNCDHLVRGEDGLPGAWLRCRSDSQVEQDGQKRLADVAARCAASLGLGMSGGEQRLEGVLFFANFVGLHPSSEMSGHHVLWTGIRAVPVPLVVGTQLLSYVEDLKDALLRGQCVFASDSWFETRQ